MFDPRVEAAVLARYGVDPHLCSLRRLRVLLDALPPGYWGEADHPAIWSTEAHLLAGVIDAVNQTTWMVAAVNSKRRPKPVKPMQRPGSAAAEKKTVTWRELAGVVRGGGLG